MWTLEPPNKAGGYWFYGYRFGRQYSRSEKPVMVLVSVMEIANGLCLVGDGHFMFEHEAQGVWMPADIPESPDLSQFGIDTNAN